VEIDIGIEGKMVFDIINLTSKSSYINGSINLVLCFSKNIINSYSRDRKCF
jgi:hypothetical protein